MRSSVLALPILLISVHVSALAAADGPAPAKPTDVVTVGTPAIVGGPTPVFTHATPIAVTPKTAVPDASARIVPANGKTAAPAPVLNAAQRQKLASAPVMPAPRPDTHVKPVDLSTTLPAPATAIAPRATGADLTAPRPAGDPIRVFGVLPRPEWARGVTVKPEEVRTQSTTPSPETAPPSPQALQQNAATLQGTARPKPPEITTVGPRDPSAPSPVRQKPARPAGAEKEVRP